MKQTTTDFSSAVQAMVDNGCTSAVLVSYAADGAMILDEMASQGVDWPSIWWRWNC